MGKNFTVVQWRRHRQQWRDLRETAGTICGVISFGIDIMIVGIAAITTTGVVNGLFRRTARIAEGKRKHL